MPILGRVGARVCLTLGVFGPRGWSLRAFLTYTAECVGTDRRRKISFSPAPNIHGRDIHTLNYYCAGSASPADASTLTARLDRLQVLHRRGQAVSCLCRDFVARLPARHHLVRCDPALLLSSRPVTMRLTVVSPRCSLLHGRAKQRIEIGCVLGAMT